MMTPTTKVAGPSSFLVAALTAMFVTLASTPLRAQTCVGDCSGDGAVTVDEIVTMVNIALGQTAVTACPAGDPSNDGAITVDEILQAVNNALNGCMPSGGCTTATVIAMLDFDPLTITDLAGLEMELDYPTEALSIPGSLSDPSVAERVTDISGVDGFFAVADLDTDTDGTDDRVRTSAVVVGATYGPGDFQRAQFDCEPGAEVPAVEDFTCSIVGATDAFGNPLPLEEISCSLTIGTP